MTEHLIPDTNASRTRVSLSRSMIVLASVRIEYASSSDGAIKAPRQIVPSWYGTTEIVHTHILRLGTEKLRPHTTSQALDRSDKSK